MAERERQKSERENEWVIESEEERIRERVREGNNGRENTRE